MIKGTITDKTKLPQKGGFISGMARAIAILTIKLMGIVKQDKLSGQVLNRKSGRLSRSINAKFADGGMTGIVGTNVEYARIHENGGVINHPGGTAYFFDKRTQMARFVRNSDPIAVFLRRTKPHQIPMPKRSFLASALVDLQPSIQPTVDKEMKKAISV